MCEFNPDLIPPLTPQAHKGHYGRIAVVGGCEEYTHIPYLVTNFLADSIRYTGAPFFTAMACLKTGADLAFVICSRAAAGPIKSYSPDLIVYPILNEQHDDGSFNDTINMILKRIDILVIGPGLGRAKDIQKNAGTILHMAQKLDIACIIDGDGHFLVATQPSVITAPKNVVFTPNFKEYATLCNIYQIDASDPSSSSKLAAQLPKAIFVHKGMVDHIFSDNGRLACDLQGSCRRCGGQGDLLAGIVAVFLHWIKLLDQDAVKPKDVENIRLSACFNACTLVRTAARLAFVQKQRGTLALDILDHIQIAFEQLIKDQNA